MMASSDLDPAGLIRDFNNLPRSEYAPSGEAADAPNRSHISLRNIPSDPPSNVLFIISPPSRTVQYIEALPPDSVSGSIALKAGVWSLLLLKAWTQTENGPPKVRPWTWDCNDAEMAGALSETFRGIGVQEPSSVGVGAKDDNEIADEAWECFIENLIQYQSAN